MSKTYKKYFRGQFRCPRGYKRAKIGGSRPGAIPPHSWDDVSPCKTVFMPWQVARNMCADGIIKAVAVKKLVNKFGLSHRDARKIINDMYR